MSGYWATGSDLTVTSPMRIIIIARTVAKIGRSMKNFENIRQRVYLDSGVGFAVSLTGLTVIPSRTLSRARVT